MIRAAGYLFWRLCRVIVGLILLALGLFLSLPGVPGPGIVLIVLGFGILGRHFHWAHRANIYVKEKLQEVLDRRSGTATNKRETDHG